MVRIASRKMISKSGVVVPTTAAGTSLGGGSVSIGNTSTAANVSIRPGPSINQLSGAANPTGVRSESSINTNYKLSIASMLLAMKNQALGSLSLGGSKAGGSVTENFSGINLG